MSDDLQTLDAVLADARQHAQDLEARFDAPVLLVVSEDAIWDGATAVTAPGQTRPVAGRPPSTPPRPAPSTFVVQLRARNPKAKKNDKLSFGRSSICDVVLPFAPVSKHHGFFQLLGQAWLVMDVGSTNGTVVDGKVATEANPLPLADGATLQLGKLSARFLTAAAFVAVLRQRLAL